MADKLTPNGRDDSNPGSNGPEPLTEDEYLGLSAEYDEAESEQQAAIAACKAPKKAFTAVKKRISERMSLESFERARADRMKPGSQREQEDAEYRAMMAWVGKPVAVGGQSAFDFAVKEAGPTELAAIESDGLKSGQRGDADDANTFSPGTDRFQAFDVGYKQGFSEFMADQAALAGATPSDAEPKKGRGRPRGSKNAPKEAGAAA
jgi:hypothetical protein